MACGTCHHAVSVYTEFMSRLEWDAAKALANLRKHGVRFEEAITAFDDPFALIAFDDMHSEAEIREILLGRATRNLLVVVFTVRGQGRRRIISARKASHEERRRYEASKTIPL